jgi:hypothetical protein
VNTGSEPTRKHCQRHYRGIVALIVLTGCVGCRETIEERYETVRAAEQAGAIRRGWIPYWIPPSAKDIAEIHNLDTNARLLAFSFDSYATDAFLKACFPVERVHVVMPTWAPASWWPTELRQGSSARGRLRFFSCEDHDTGMGNGRKSVLAIDEETKRAFNWGAPG